MSGGSQRTCGPAGSGAEAATRLQPSTRPTSSSPVGYRGPVAAQAAGITYRQLDYWARAGLVEPSLRTVRHAQGISRLYRPADVLLLKTVRRLLEAGVCLQQIRATTTALREALTTAQGPDADVQDDARTDGAPTVETAPQGDLQSLTLMSDGASVYPCTSADEVIDLVQGGQGVFGIAVGRVWLEVQASLAALPGERPDGTPAGAASRADRESGDELAQRRAARAIG